jgi:hypothetical protein
MSVDAHLAQLERKHRTLEQEIETERAHPKTDDVKIASLKRRKLKIKDEIVVLKQGKPRTVN